MDQTTPRDRHPETDSPIVDLDLEVQIARAEQSVIARDRRIVGRSDAIAASVPAGPRHLLRRHRGVVVALAASGIALAGIVAWWRWGAARRTPRGVAFEQAPRVRRTTSLMDMLPLAWRLIPGVIKDAAVEGVRDGFHRFVAAFSKLRRDDEAGPSVGDESSAGAAASRSP